MKPMRIFYIPFFARDAFGNGVLNSDSVAFTAINGTGVVFSTNDTLQFGSDSTLTVTVSDTVSESFTVRVQKIGAPGVGGQSGLITVNPDTPTDLVKLTPDTIGVVATELLLRAQLIDQYGNVVPGEDLTFTVISGGGNFSGSGSATGTTNALGIGEALYTLGTDASQSPGTVNVSFTGVPTQTYTITLISDVVQFLKN